jgi:hypothetical protein
MENANELEKKLLDLPAADRERIVLAAWESLLRDPKALADERIDPEGILLAKGRDSEIEFGKSQTIDDKDFRRLTGGNK